MAVTQTTRMALTRWSAGTDPFNRAQMDDDHAQLEAKAAGFLPPGTAAARPAAAAAYDRFLYWAYDTGALSICVDTTGAGTTFEWRPALLAEASGHVYLNPGDATERQLGVRRNTRAVSIHVDEADDSAHLTLRDNALAALGYVKVHAGANLRVSGTAVAVADASNNAVDLGLATARFRDLYMSRWLYGSLLRGYREFFNNLGNVTGAVTLDLALTNTFTLNPTGNITLSVANASLADTYTPITIRVLNSTYAITWPTGTRFAGGAAPVLDGETWVSGVVDAAGVLSVGVAWTGVA